MIFDNLNNSKQYETVHPLMKVAFDFLASYSGKELGRYELDGGVFALVQAYNSKAAADCKWEAHRNYIDLQFVFKGREQFGVANEKDMSVSVEYNPAKDVAFYIGEGSILNMKDNDFVIVFPWDAHKPQMGNGGHVDKVVIKIPY